MGRSTKTVDEVIKFLEETPEAEELWSLDRALSRYLVNKPHRQFGLKDKEAVKLSMIRKCPSLQATIEEWNNLLDKF